jgi:hypothetical protein
MTVGIYLDPKALKAIADIRVIKDRKATKVIRVIKA